MQTLYISEQCKSSCCEDQEQGQPSSHEELGFGSVDHLLAILRLCGLAEMMQIETLPATALEFRKLPDSLGFLLLTSNLTAMLAKAWL